MSPQVIAECLKNACRILPEDKFKLLERAFYFAEKAHEGQKRKSGEPYFEHPIAVAKKVCKKYKNLSLTIAALLHDTVEDCEVIKREVIYKKFGKEICFLVDAVTKDKKEFYIFPEIQFDDKIERFLWAGMKDVRVLLLKLADREHNIETLNHLKDKKQVRMAFETQAIFEPLKKLLNYDKPISIEKTQQKLNRALRKHKINTAAQFKQFLFDKSFQNINHNTFNTVYNNSSSVIWRIEGMDMYKKLCSTRAFKNKIDILNVKSNGNWLTADFKFKKGAITNNKLLKMNLLSYNTR